MKGVGTLILASAVLAGVHPVSAQQAIDQASVSGRVTDPSGTPVPGALVSARHLETEILGAVVTDDGGRFRFPSLRVGRYEIAVRQPGFTRFTRQITLSAGAAFELPVSLVVEGIDASVMVTAEAPVVEAARSQIATTLSRAEVENMPLNGRRFLDLALLVPGVSPANIPSTQLFPETSAVPGTSLSLSSQRNLSNSFVVDGLSANDDAAGLSGITYSVDAIEQVQVVTSGGQAELGRAIGGYVNIVTRSGTNVLRGSLDGYLRDDRLTASNTLTGSTLPMSQVQYGATVGGPILRNRTFHFSSVEHLRLDQSGLVTIAPASVSVINARLAEVGYPGPRTATGVYPSPVRSTNVLARIDHEVNGRNQLGLRVGLYDVEAKASRGAGGLSAPTASSALDNLDRTVALSHTAMLSGRTLIETRAQVASSDLEAPPTDAIGPAVSIAGVASFGTSSGSPTRRVNRMSQLVHNVSHQAGAHAFKAGVDVLHNANDITYPRAFRGSYTFSSLASFLAGTYNNAGFAQTFGVPQVSQSNWNAGVYAQDEWKVAPRVTLNVGVRYDLQFLQTVETDTDNVSPRLGVAWAPADSRRTVVRGSVGVFYDRVPLRALANALLSAGNTTDLANLRQIGVSLSPEQLGAPGFPHILTGVLPSVTLVNLTTMDPHLQNASSRQASVEMEHQLGRSTTVSVGYQYLRAEHLLMAVNQNVPSCAASGTNNGCRPQTAYANNSQYSSVADSNFHGLHVSLLQRPARWGSYRVSYMLSTSMNNVGEFFFSSPIDPFDLSKDWGRSDDDQRHRLVVSGVLSSSMAPAATAWQLLTHGFRLSGVVQAYSAFPLNITSGVTTVQGTQGRPIVDGAFIERNAGVGSSFVSVTARVTRAFPVGARVRVEGLAEGFNLANRRNVLARNTNFGAGRYPDAPSPTFGQITAVGEPRSFQLGLRVRF